MEALNTSAKIKFLIEMAHRGEISWLALDPVLNRLTDSLEKSRQIIRILLKELDTHQSSCLTKRSNDGNDLSEDITEIDEDQSITDEVKINQRSFSEDVGIVFDEEMQYPEQLTKIRSKEMARIDNEQDSTSEAHEEFDADISEADAELGEVFEENEVSKSIQWVEAFKDQLYTFVGDISEEESKENNDIQLYDHDKETYINKDKEDYSSEAMSMTSITSFECVTCGKCFGNKQHLNVHEKIHTGEKPFKCEACKKSFVQLGHLKSHERTHTGEKPYKCKTCKKGFAVSNGLKSHERTHTGEIPFQCKSCKKGFAQSNNLKKHERIHTGEKPYKCKTCRKGFAQSNNLKSHERSHTGEKPFQCKTCKKCFFQSIHLRQHERIHSGEKPYKCNTCKKGFTVSGALKVHKRYHTGEKPYKCKICKKGFAQSNDLKIHNRSHTGEKPFQCKTCKKCFAQLAHLKTHEKIHVTE